MHFFVKILGESDKVNAQVLFFLFMVLFMILEFEKIKGRPYACPLL